MSGRELKDGYYKVAEFTTESGYEKVLELLNEKNDIDIISCATDTIAAGAIEAIHTYIGSRIPKNVEDTGSRFRYILENTAIQVTGFGDNQLLKAVTGGITTVDFGLKTSGIRGAELLLDVIERGENIPMEIKLGFRLAEIDDPEENIEE